MRAAAATVTQSAEFADYRETLVQWLTGDVAKDEALEQTGRALCQRAREVHLPPEHLIIALESTASAGAQFGSSTPFTYAREERAQRYHIALDRLLECYFDDGSSSEASV